MTPLFLDTGFLLALESADDQHHAAALDYWQSFESENPVRKEGMPWNHMAILYRARFMGEDIAQGLERKEIPVEWLDRDKGDRRYRPGEESVKVMTMHSSKGLEFPVVVVPYAGYAPQMEAGADEAARRREEARLLYVAMTRAMDRLVLTHHTETVFSARLRQAVYRVA